MNKKIAKTLSLLMVMLLAISLISGCKTKKNNENQGTPTAPSTTTSNGDGRQMEGNLYLTGTPVVKDKETFKIMITYSLGTKDPNDMLLYKERAAKTNVDIKYDYVLATAVNERKATMFATGDLPDALANIVSTDEVAKYAPTGTIIPIDQYMGKYTPRLNKLIEQFPNIKSASTMPDGKIYGFPSINFYSVWPGDGNYIKTSWVINKDWIKKLGLNEPTTTDELKKVLNEFKTKDPNGNNKADEIPYSFCYADEWAGNMGEAMFGPFGIIGPSYKLNVENGKAFFAITDPRYKDAVKYIRDLYKNGLIDKDAFTQTAEQYRGKGQAETPVYGLVNGWTGDLEVGPARIMTNENKNAPYGPLAPVKGPSGSQMWDNMSAGVAVNRLVITNKCKSPQTLARYVDELYEEENSVQEVWGSFSQCVDKKDGTYVRVPTPEGWNVEEWLRDTTTRILPNAITYDIANKVRLQPADLSKAPLGKNTETKFIYSSVYAPFAVKEYYPDVIRTPEEVDESGRLVPQLKNLMKQKEVEWMMGTSDIDKEYDAFMKELKKYQIDRVTELYQKALDRYNGK